MPPTLPGGLNDFVELVIPELQRRGVFRKEYSGRTLREHLGLPRPVSRYERARERSGRIIFMTDTPLIVPALGPLYLALGPWV